MAQAAKLFTLTEVAKRTNISMPTLQRYKKLYQKRIPSQGTGRKQRYPEEALSVFLELKKENIGRRGRPRKSASTAPAPSVAKAAKKPSASRSRSKATAKNTGKKSSSSEGLLTLTQVSKLTGVSYPTLLRYVKTNLADIPHSGTGRARRFKPGAVAVFKSLRERSKRGRKSKAALAAAAGSTAPKSGASKPARRGRPPKEVDAAQVMERVIDLEKTVKRLEKMLAKQQKQIEKPFRVVLARK